MHIYMVQSIPQQQCHKILSFLKKISYLYSLHDEVLFKSAKEGLQVKLKVINLFGHKQKPYQQLLYAS